MEYNSTRHPSGFRLGVPVGRIYYFDNVLNTIDQFNKIMNVFYDKMAFYYQIRLTVSRIFVSLSN